MTTIKLDISKRAMGELWMSEYDTAQEGSSSEAHLALADHLKAAQDLPNGKIRLTLTAETLIYLAENIHYHIDRMGDSMSGLSPKYDWDTWSDTGATLSSLRGLDIRVKKLADKLGLRYRVWSNQGGMIYRD